MLYLAVEQSTARGGMALMRGTHLIAETRWDAGRRANQALGCAIAEWQAAGVLDMARVDCYVLGVGPGAYSGLRGAAALVTACALPGRRMVYAVSSAETLAWQLAPMYNGRPIMILGDARREHYWLRVYRSRGLAPPLPETGWHLCRPDNLPWCDGLVAATADWERIGVDLQRSAPPGATIVGEAVYPQTAALARLAVMRMADAVPSEPAQPIYPHAPVKNQPASLKVSEAFSRQQMWMAHPS